MSVNRKTARKHLAGLFKAGITSAEKVFEAGPDKLKGQTPIIYLSSSGSERTRWTAQGFLTKPYYNVHVLVLRSKADENYTTEDAEDILDDIENQVAVVIDNNQIAKGLWDAIDYAGRTNADGTVIEDGLVYIHEIIPIKISLLG